MEPKQMILDRDSNRPPTRDDVRRWVVDEQCRMRKRSSRIALSLVALFISGAAMLCLLMNEQAREIRRLVEKNPSRSLICLEEITKELCNEPPAQYFVHQLKPRPFTGLAGSGPRG